MLSPDERLWALMQDDEVAFALSAVLDVAVLVGAREAWRLYEEHATTDLHTGNTYYDLCPTCMNYWPKEEI